MRWIVGWLVLAAVMLRPGVAGAAECHSEPCEINALCSADRPADFVLEGHYLDGLPYQGPNWQIDVIHGDTRGALRVGQQIRLQEYWFSPTGYLLRSPDHGGAMLFFGGLLEEGAGLVLFQQHELGDERECQYGTVAEAAERMMSRECWPRVRSDFGIEEVCSGGCAQPGHATLLALLMTLFGIVVARRRAS